MCHVTGDRAIKCVIEREWSGTRTTAVVVMDWYETRWRVSDDMHRRRSAALSHTEKSL